MPENETKFDICVYNVGFACKNPKPKKPSGAEEFSWGVIRFCREVVGCDSCLPAQNLKDAEAKRQEMGIT